MAAAVEIAAAVAAVAVHAGNFLTGSFPKKRLRQVILLAVEVAFFIRSFFLDNPNLLVVTNSKNNARSLRLIRIIKTHTI
jgi:hypothetical protein